MFCHHLGNKSIGNECHIKALPRCLGEINYISCDAKLNHNEEVLWIGLMGETCNIDLNILP